MEETIYVIKAHRDKDFRLTGYAFRSECEANCKVHELICEMMIELASDDELDAAVDYTGIPKNRNELLPVLIALGDVDGWASTVNECGQLYSWEEITVKGKSDEAK